MAQPSLSEAQFGDLNERIAEIETSLLRAFPVASTEQHQHLETKLKNLQHFTILCELINSFRKTIKKEANSNAFKRWIPKGLIEQVIQACCTEQYPENYIEQIFYKHGDINGLIVLHLGTRNQSHHFPKINALPPDMKAALAKQCGKEEVHSILLLDWIRTYDRFKNELDQQNALPRLYRYGRKRELVSEQSNIPRKRHRGPTGNEIQNESTKEASENPPLPALSIDDVDESWSWGDMASFFPGYENPSYN